MAVGDITYGIQAAIANIDRLHSNTNGVAEAFGEIVFAGELGLDVELTVPIAASSTGSYDVYLVESQDGATWTDGIDPATAGDVVGKIADASFVKSVPTVYNGTDRTEAVFTFTIPALVRSKYIGLVLVNNSGQTIPSSGAVGNSVTMKVATA